MRGRNIKLLLALYLAVGVPLVLALPVLAAEGNVTQVQTFIRSIIQVVAGLAGLVATGFFVVGGEPHAAARRVAHGRGAGGNDRRFRD